MKKVVSILIALVLVMALACPAFAASENSEFVPSISYKSAPEIVMVKDENGVEHAGVVRDADGNIVGYVDLDDLTIIPLAEVLEDAESAELIKSLYQSIISGEMKVPFEKLKEGLNQLNMVIRDMFEIRWAGESKLAEGQTLEITFNLGVVADADIFAMTYSEADGEWESIVKTVNNGDGTVTCTFAHFCPAILAARTGELQPVDPADTTNSSNAWIWIVVGAVVILAGSGAALYFLYYKKKMIK